MHSEFLRNDNMLISESGRVVVIDDKSEEIEPVLTELGKYGIPYLYFDGTLNKLPEKPLKGIRFIFLDIELRGMKGQPDKTKASGLVAILKKIISVENGPYAIGFWTAHKEVIPLVLGNCETGRIPPVAWIDVEKLVGIETLTERLRDKLKLLGAFQLYVEWENIVNAASIEFVRLFSSLASDGKNWSKDSAAIFYRLYKAYVEKQELSNKEEQFKCACHLMNRIFLDTLENVTRRDLKLPDGFTLENKELPNDTPAKLNTLLNFSDHIINRHSSGNVYLHKDDTLKESLILDVCKPGETPSECSLFIVIVSPECDLAQNKVFKIKAGGGTLQPLHRVLFGLKIPSEESKKLQNKRDCEYRIKPIWYLGKSYCLIIHFATMSFYSEDKFLENPLFTLRRDILFDLQSKAANHVNRLGNFLLE